MVGLPQAGIEVVDVPPQMTAMARRSRRTATKRDEVHALLITRTGARGRSVVPAATPRRARRTALAGRLPP